MAALRIQLRRDTASNWVSNNPILLPGEFGIETDTLKFKIGNGSRWNATTSYALKIGEPNGVATLNSLGRIPTSQLPDSMSISADLAAALAALTTNSISEGSTNKYFTNQRAIDAVSASISSAIATEISNRDAAILSAKNEVIYTASIDATNKANSAKTQAIAFASQDADAKYLLAVDEAVTASAAHVDQHVIQETATRNNAINSAISTEIINRNIAIQAAVSGLSSGGSSTITLGTISTGNPGTNVSITNSGTASNPIFNFTIPRGDTGATGAQGIPGLTGATGLTGPQGPQGADGLQGLKGDTGNAGPAGSAGTITIGTVTTGTAGSNAIVTNSGTTTAAILNFTIPKGADGSGSGSSSFTGTTDNVLEGLSNLYFTNERVLSATNASFTDVYVNMNQVSEDLLSYSNQHFVTISNLGNTLDGYLTEADADLLYPKISVATGNISDSVISSNIARTSDVSSSINAAIANVINGAPASLDTLKELADQLASDESAAATLTTLVGTKLSSTTAASTYAPIASPTFTGTVSGITKSMVNLGNVDNTSDLSKPISTATQTALDSKISISSASATYATKVSPVFTGTVDFSGATVTGISILPTQTGNSGKYLTTNGTSTSWADLNLTAYATSNNASFTGTFSAPLGTITSSMIADGTIVNSDISADAAISKTKISGTAVTLSDTATVTNTMIANPTITINGTAVALGASTTISSGTKTFYNNTGTLPTTGMVAGDIYIQY